jgi:hypothetical protein
MRSPKSRSLRFSYSSKRRLSRRNVGQVGPANANLQKTYWYSSQSDWHNW